MDRLLPLLDALAAPVGSADLSCALYLPLGWLYGALHFLVDAGLADHAAAGGFVLTDAGRAIRHDVTAVRELATRMEAAHRGQ